MEIRKTALDLLNKKRPPRRPTWRQKLRQLWSVFRLFRENGVKKVRTPFVRALQPYSLFLNKYLFPPFILLARIWLKIAALYVLLVLYFVRFTADTYLGYIFYMFALLWGAFPRDYQAITGFEIFCFLYASYAIGAVTMVYYAFTYPAFEKWCFKELGEERVRRLVYRSPAGQSFLWRVVGGTGVIFSGIAAMESGGELVQKLEAKAEYVRAEVRHAEQKLRAIDYAYQQREKSLLNMHNPTFQSVIEKRLDDAIAIAEAQQERADTKAHQDYMAKVQAAGLGKHTISAIKQAIVVDSVSKAASDLGQAAASSRTSLVETIGQMLWNANKSNNDK